MTVEENHKHYHPILLYDGDCTMCNASIQFILRHEKDNTLKFSSLEKIDSNFPHLKILSEALPDAIHLILKDKVLIESDAAIAISDYLKWPYSLIKYLKIIPKAIRDIAYRAVAKRRKKLQSLFKSDCDLYSDFSDRMI